MRRWHQDRSLMLRRWAEEKRNHMEDERVFGPKHSFEHCHCSAGPGLMKKARPWDRPSRHCFWLHRKHPKEKSRNVEKEQPSSARFSSLHSNSFVERHAQDPARRALPRHSTLSLASQLYSQRPRNIEVLIV